MIPKCHNIKKLGLKFSMFELLMEKNCFHSFAQRAHSAQCTPFGRPVLFFLINL